MSNTISVKVKCTNNNEWYDIDSSTDVEELIEEIKDEIKEEDRWRVIDSEDIKLKFAEWEVSTELLGSFISEDEISADLPEAIEALENADRDIEIYEAYEDNMGTSPSSASDIQDLIKDADEAYQGEYRDDEEFAKDLAEQVGDIKEDVRWPYTCIDWEFAAKELMYDYFESNGHYFRNI